MFFLSSPIPAPAPLPQPQALPSWNSNPFTSPVTKQYGSRVALTASHPQTKQHVFTDPYAGGKNHKGYYTAHAPSPLRTARNANLNLMSSPTRDGLSKSAGTLLGSSPPRCADAADGDGVDENWITDEIDGDRPGCDARADSTPAGNLNASVAGGSSTFVTAPFDSTPRPQTTTRVAAFSSPLDDSSFTFRAAAPQPSRVSQWELRSRESSPSTLLATHTTRNREERKSKFLDRIRRRRDNERSELVGDQLLRMDFVKERRGWQEQMARRAAVEAGVEIEEEEEEEQEEDEEILPEEMSPTEEYDDLVRQYEFEHEFDRQGGMMPQDEFPVDDADDDAEYERLFREMEILSQQSGSASQSASQSHSGDQSSGGQRRDITLPTREQQPSQHEVEHRSGGGGGGGGGDAMDIS
ncbi:hypothetical protein A1O7_06557 [Cladophialophora yegresii CBS 114405]|uniref:Uncharacterized protein n=1 Tax=Cladophialophora yegresii CBS 114405 TaxID=1182544 RepID=W9W3L2_9EURO|nr:uncharacterized protein A1O7_06557 [Cladophialophora yegresii CBS 114405]EXJ59126.1 hypothetical protein A1O7_06557 [Cladophialophora yegresii CBS 114405]